MKKKTAIWMKIGVLGCAAVLGVSAANLPVNAMASAKAPVLITASAQQVSVPAAAGVKVEEKELHAKSTNLETHIRVPQLTGMLDTHYQEELNDIILSHAEKDLAAWEKKADEAAAEAKAAHLKYLTNNLYVTYTLKSDGTGQPAGVISLEVITEGSQGGTSMPRIDTYNVINTAEAQRVTLSDLLGVHYKEKLDADILAKMNMSPDLYFLEEYKGTGTEQPFYIEKGDLVVVFPKYSIAPGYVGSPEFRFPLQGERQSDNAAQESKQEKTVNLDLRQIAKFTGANGVTMVSLRDVAKQLNWELTWNQAAKTAEIKKGTQWSKVTMGKDQYAALSKAPKSLGTAPVMRSGKLFVPLQFISGVLNVQVQH